MSSAEQPEKDPEAVNELEQPIWAVISFDKVEATGLSYSEAADLLSSLRTQGVYGLALVTADAASRYGR